MKNKLLWALIVAATVAIAASLLEGWGVVSLPAAGAGDFALGGDCFACWVCGGETVADGLDFSGVGGGGGVGARLAVGGGESAVFGDDFFAVDQGDYCAAFVWHAGGGDCGARGFEESGAAGDQVARLF